MKNRKKGEGEIRQKGFTEGKAEKPGMLRKFLDWIARGAEKQPAGKTACPT